MVICPHQDVRIRDCEIVRDPPVSTRYNVLVTSCYNVADSRQIVSTSRCNAADCALLTVCGCLKYSIFLGPPEHFAEEATLDQFCLFYKIEIVQIGNLGWCLSSSEGGPQVSLLKIWPFNYRSCLHPTHTSGF